MEITRERALKAARILEAYDKYDIPTACVDMLTDIRHYCHAHKLSFDGMLQLAEMHFNAETPEV